MNRKAKHRKESSPAGETEDRASLAVTVFWMLTLLATLLAESLTVVARFALGRMKEVPNTLAILPGLLFFLALVAGTICAGLTPVVFRVRASPPPRAIAVVAVVAGLLPWVYFAYGAIAK